MYENYVGLPANIILTDGREVKGTITEVLDESGSMKLGNACIFKNPNEPPRELVSFLIPGNRIQNVYLIPQERSEPTSIVPPAVTSNATSPIQPQVESLPIPVELQPNGSSSVLNDTLSTPEIISNPNLPDNVESDYHISTEAEEKPAATISKTSNKIPTFASAKPNKARNFVDTIEMEYDELWEGTKSPAINKSPVIKEKTPSKRAEAATPEQVNKPTASPVKNAIHQQNHQLSVLEQINRAAKPAMPTSNAVPPKRQQPKVDENATNQLLANLNIATIRSKSTSIPKTEVAPSAVKKQPAFAIPAGLIPPKARRKSSLDVQLDDKQKRATVATLTSLVQNVKPNDSQNHPPPTGSIRTVSEGHDCPLVTPSVMRNVHAICDSESGPNNIMIMESAGVSAAMMALKAIGGHRRIQPNNHNAAPLVVVLAGNNNYTGSYGLAAARHLLNRGCQVVVCIAAGPNANISQRIASQEYVVQLAGGRIVRRVEELPQQLTTPVDIIIDALLGSQTSFADLKADYESFQIVTAAIDWANNNKAPVLSIDFPSGIDPVQGTPYHINHRIKPKWTLCYGAPTYGCSSRNVTGELFLADIGIPEISWKKANVQPAARFGQDIIVALEYAG